MVRLAGGFKLQDILSTRHHSDDFIETRAEFIERRLRFMALFYAIAVPLWIPADYLLISAAHFGPMATARLVLAAILLTLGLLTLRKLDSRRIHALLVLTIAAPTAFYVVTMLILQHGVAETPLAGYSFMPFLMVAMLGVFPLTVAWGLGLTSLIVLMHLALVAWLGQLATVETFDALWVFALFAGVALWIQSGQLLMLLRLYRESTQDPLTGMINRRVLMKRVAHEIDHMRQGGAGFSLLMFDLDRFKRINDNHGHLTGDEVLKTTAGILQGGLRPHDIVARFGGEEFVAVLPATSGAEALAIAERLRQACFTTQVRAPDGQPIQLSTSVGVTEYEAPEAIEVTLNRVDEALYQAKVGGRNRAVHSQSRA